MSLRRYPDSAQVRLAEDLYRQDCAHAGRTNENATGSVAVVDPYAIILTVAAETRTITVEADDRTLVVVRRADAAAPALKPRGSAVR